MSTKVGLDEALDMCLREKQRVLMKGIPPKRELDDLYKASPELQTKLLKAVNKEDRRAGWRGARSIAAKVAVAVMLLATLTTVVFVPVKAVREAVVTAVIEWNESFMGVLFHTDGGAVPRSIADVGFEYLPEGYKVVADYSTSTSINIDFEDGAGGTISISIDLADSQIKYSIDNEHSSTYPIEFSGKSMIWTLHGDGCSSLLWEKDGILYFLHTTEPLNQAILIAEGIKV